MTEQKSRPRWSDDSWSALTMDEVAAWRDGWRAGYAAAKAQAVKLDVWVSPYSYPNNAIATLKAAIAAMEPPA
jgi:hypothetical protein